MDNYICIDGVKVLLNDSQISEMRVILEKKETKKDSPFKRQKYGDGYYCITSNGEVRDACESGDSFDSVHYDNANYCTDEELLDQRALEEILARRLWRYSMEHDGDKIDWSSNKSKYVIYYDAENGLFYTTNNVISQAINTTYFIDRKTAVDAIEMVIKPFMKEYPSFKNYRTCYAQTQKESNMKVCVTYTYNKVIDVPDDATDDEIRDICAKEAPREDYDEFRWENY